MIPLALVYNEYSRPVKCHVEIPPLALGMARGEVLFLFTHHE